MSLNQKFPLHFVVWQKTKGCVKLVFRQLNLRCVKTEIMFAAEHKDIGEREKGIYTMLKKPAMFNKTLLSDIKFS